jgi:hypothetical protein
MTAGFFLWVIASGGALMHRRQQTQ